MGIPVMVQRCREFTEPPPMGPTLPARPSITSPSCDWQMNRFSANERHPNKVRIRIITPDKVFVEHIIHRSVIQTSQVLQANLHYSLIWVDWRGTLDVFNMYAAWLYSDIISTSTELKGRDPTAETTKADYMDLVCCWGMGNTLQDDVYQDLVLHSIQKRLQSWRPGHGKNPFVYALTAALVVDVYRETEAGAPLRMLMVDAAAKFGHAEDFEHFQRDSGYPLAFTQDLVVALGRERDRRGYVVLSPRLVSVVLEEYPPLLRPSPSRRVWLVEGDEECYVPASPSPFCNAQQEISVHQLRPILKKPAGKQVRFVPGDLERECFF